MSLLRPVVNSSRYAAQILSTLHAKQISYPNSFPRHAAWDKVALTFAIWMGCVSESPTPPLICLIYRLSSTHVPVLPLLLTN